jgi:DNA-binding NarL/FixJ family response regulator
VTVTNTATVVVLDEQNPARHPLIKWCSQSSSSVEVVHVRTVEDAIDICQRRRIDAVMIAAKLASQSGQSISQRLMALFPKLSIFVAQESHSTANGEPDPSLLVQSLSWRERQVFELVVEGKSSGEIAAMLGLSSKTVDTYRSRLMQKLRADDLPSLVRIAIRTGVTSLEFTPA